MQIVIHLLIYFPIIFKDTSQLNNREVSLNNILFIPAYGITTFTIGRIISSRITSTWPST